MKFNVVKEPIPYLIIENTFSADELALIYKELEFIQPKLQSPFETSAASFPNGEFKKKATGVFLDKVYAIREFSDILRINRKLFDYETRHALTLSHPAYGLIHTTRSDSTLVSYYEDNDYYQSHVDNSAISIVTWFFKEPKNFLGGDFIFSDYNIKITPQNNMTVIFFSCYKHEVTEIKMKDKTVPCSGRFSMSLFCSH